MDFDIFGQKKPPAQGKDDNGRDALAERLIEQVLWMLKAIVVVILAGATTILLFRKSSWFGDDFTGKDYIATLQTLLTAILPVVAAWVGAIIAFYFGAKNLKEATDAAISLTGSGTARQRPAKDVGRAFTIGKNALKLSDQGDTALPFADILKLLQSEPRVAIVAIDGSVPHVIHEVTALRFDGLWKKQREDAKSELPTLEKSAAAANTAADQAAKKRQAAGTPDAAADAEAKKLSDAAKAAADALQKAKTDSVATEPTLASFLAFTQTGYTDFKDMRALVSETITYVKPEASVEEVAKAMKAKNLFCEDCVVTNTGLRSDVAQTWVRWDDVSGR